MLNKTSVIPVNSRMYAKQTPEGFILEFTGMEEKIIYESAIIIVAKCPFVIVAEHTSPQAVGN